MILVFLVITHTVMGEAVTENQEQETCTKARYKKAWDWPDIVLRDIKHSFTFMFLQATSSMLYAPSFGGFPVADPGFSKEAPIG